MSAVMAHEGTCSVERKRNIASRTFDSLTTFPAGNKCIKTPSIYKEHRLFARTECGVQPLVKSSGNNTSVSALQFISHIYYGHFRKRTSRRPLIKGHKGKLSRLSHMIACNRRSRASKYHRCALDFCSLKCGLACVIFRCGLTLI